MVPSRKRQDETKCVQIEIQKGEEEKENKRSQNQQRKKHDRTQGEFACFRLARSAGEV